MSQQVVNVGATANDGSGDPLRYAFQKINTKFQESVSILDFGADPTGVADSAPAIRLAIAYLQGLGFGGELKFPAGQFRVTSTIEVVDMAGVRFTGALGSINAFPTIADGVHDTCIFWDGVSAAAPLFYFARGQNNTFEHLVFKGGRGSDSAIKAYAGVWIDRNHENYRFYDCKFSSFAIGIRVCSGFNHSTNAWTPGVAAYDGYFDPAAAANGGFASDNGSYINCSFGGNSIAGISVESAQALDMRSDKCLFIANWCSFFFVACQGFSISTPTFLIDTTASIYCYQQGTLGGIHVTDSHVEGGALILFESATSSNVWGAGMVFDSCAGGDINMAGVSGTFTIRNSTLRTVSMKSANVSLVIENSIITSLDKTAALGNGPLLRLSNVTVVTTLSPHALAYANLIIETSSLPTYTALASTTKLSPNGLLPALMLGGINDSSTVGGMEGVALNPSANALQIGAGAYVGAGGTWIATATTGAVLTMINNGFIFQTFTGAVLGAAPTFVDMLHADLSVGLQLPRFAADPSATPGTMFYDTATSKVRIRDGAGWRDF